MNLLDRLFLLLAGLGAIYITWQLALEYRRSPGKTRHNLYYMVSFGVLLVAGLLLIGLGYGILESPWVVIVSVLIPAGLAVGLVSEFFPRYARAYLIFAVVGLLLIAVTRFTGPPLMATLVLIVVHTAAGLVIFGAPFYLASQKQAPGGFVWVGVGGALIGLGGIALAFLKTGGQLLFFSADFVFMILAPLLFLMTLAFVYGLVQKLRAG